MRSPLSGSIATFLIFVPLVAVPLFAILGMPQLSSGPAVAASDDLKFAAEEPTQSAGNADLVAPVRVSDLKSDAVAETPREQRTAARENDPFAEFTRDSDASRQAATARSSSSQPKRPQRWSSEGNGLPQKALLSSDRPNDDRAAANPSDRSAAAGSPNDHPPQQSAEETPAPAKMPVARRALPEAEAIVALATDPPSPNTAETPAEARSASTRRSSQGTGWNQAIGRLNALGIRDYQLQPGERTGEFNFSCRFAAPSNPRVIHRFEAEAADPLDAVNQVLRQLDEWRARRAERGQVRTTATDGASAPRAAESSEVELTNRTF